MKRKQSLAHVTDLRSDIETMYHAPLPASRTGPLYNAFSYPTKISPEAIALFIATHTDVGATVADVFSGSGTTGLASLLCERPTERMRNEAKRLGIEPRWGPRTTHLFDVGVLGAFMSRSLTDPPCPREFATAVVELLGIAGEQLNECYVAVDPNGRLGTIRHIIWSELISCSTCGSQHRLWDVAARRKPARFVKQFKCRTCGDDQHIDACARIELESIDAFGRLVRQRARVPVEVHGVTGKTKWIRPATEADVQVALDPRHRSLPASAPDAPLRWSELHRSGYHTGITHLHHFYTPRNFLAVSTLMDLTNRWPEPMRSALQFTILSYNASHSTLMTRIVAKKNQSEFALTGAQSGVLYVSGLPVEKNVLLGVARKSSTIKNAFAMVHGGKGEVHVHNMSSESLPLPDSSVDYVFTDPPFGDYIPYAEINQINELWLGSVTDAESETVVSGSKGKGIDEYRRSMAAIFCEVNRVLKPSGIVTVVFHSAHSRIWRALTDAFDQANLRVRLTSVLDKLQSSFKQVVSTVSVKGDPLILLDKGAIADDDANHAGILEEILTSARGSDSTDVRSLFSTYAAMCLAKGQRVEVSAAEFTKIIKRALDVAA